MPKSYLKTKENVNINKNNYGKKAENLIHLLEFYNFSISDASQSVEDYLNFEQTVDKVIWFLCKK